MLLVRVLTEDPDREDPKQTSGAEIPYYPQIRVSVRSSKPLALVATPFAGVSKQCRGGS